MRKEFLKKLEEEQIKIVENLEQSLQSYKTAADIDEDDTLDPEDFAHQSEAKDMELRYNVLLEQAKQNLSKIKQLEEVETDSAREGSLLETSKNFFFLGISVPQFSFKEKDAFCVSGDAPIFQEFLGKNVGNRVRMGNTEHEILAIY